MKKILRILAFFLLCLPLRAATYYIDFSGSDANNGTSKGTPWKRAPGMSGFSAAYTHTAGDQFIFKGGVTWDNTIGPWVIPAINSGTISNIDYYGVDKTWYTGTSWTNPIFDGGSQNPVATSEKMGYIQVYGSYVTLDGLQVQNIGVPYVSQGNYAIFFRDSHDITAENMVLPVQSGAALIYENTVAADRQNFTFSGNNISECHWGIVVATSQAGATATHIYIHDNVIHDFHQQLIAGVHGDGIFIFSGSDQTTPQYPQDVHIYNNSFYGDFSVGDTGTGGGMTAFAYLSVISGPIYIYNNYGYDTASTSGYVFEGSILSTAPDGHINIYNNSFAMDTASTGWAGFFNGGNYSGGASASITLKNNIYTGGTSVLNISDAAAVSGLVSDYNDFYAWLHNGFANMGGPVDTYAQFKALGYEAHGLNENPLFVSSTSLQLQAGSPAIGTGYNLSAVFTTDAAGNTWVPPWSMGAYAPEPAASLSTSSLAFSPPSYGTGVTSAAQTVTVTNAGNLNLIFTTATLSGTNSADFSISADTCVIGGVGQTIAPLGTCTVSVTFTPSIVGAKTATLSLASNDPLSPATVSLSGTGASGAVPSLSTSSLTWAGQVVGTTQSVTLTNTGNTTLTISSITISGSQFVFTGSNTCGSTLSELAACTITVAPTVNGNPATTSFTVAGNGTPATVSATLAASGIVPGAATTVGGTAGIQ